jgi:nickel superoxide dismutase
MLKTTTTLALALSLFCSAEARAHCQVPCGIYGDKQRVEMMREDAATVEKSVKLIRQLAGKRDAQSRNQLVRWVQTKEQHAEKIMRTIADYVMAQKIKPKAGKDYLAKLGKHHAVMVAAMKCKQTADPRAVAAMKKAIAGIAGYWTK